MRVEKLGEEDVCAKTREERLAKIRKIGDKSEERGERREKESRSVGESGVAKEEDSRR